MGEGWVFQGNGAMTERRKEEDEGSEHGNGDGCIGWWMVLIIGGDGFCRTWSVVCAGFQFQDLLGDHCKVKITYSSYYPYSYLRVELVK